MHEIKSCDDFESLNLILVAIAAIQWHIDTQREYCH